MGMLERYHQDLLLDLLLDPSLEAEREDRQLEGLLDCTMERNIIAWAFLHQMDQKGHFNRDMN